MREEIALSSILGASVYDSSGAFAGHVREVAIFPQEDPNRISDFIVKTREGDRLLPSRQVKTVIGSANGWTQLAFNTYGTGTGKTIKGGGPSTKALLDPAFRDRIRHTR